MTEARIIRTTRKIRPGEPDQVTTEDVDPLPDGGVPLGEIDTSHVGTRYQVSFEIHWPLPPHHTSVP